MSLNAISVFDKGVQMKPWGKKKNLKSIIKWLKEMKMDLSYSFLPIDCCVRINGEPDH